MVFPGGSLRDAKPDSDSSKLGSMQMLDVKLAQSAPPLPDLSFFERPSSATPSATSSHRDSFTRELPLSVRIPRALKRRQPRHRRTLSEPVTPRVRLCSVRLRILPAA